MPAYLPLILWVSACRIFARITSWDGVRMGKLSYGAVARIPTMSYVTYLALLCCAMRDYSCK